MAGIAGEALQRGGGGVEQQRIEPARVHPHQRVEGVRQGEDDVEVLDGQQHAPAGPPPTSPARCPGTSDSGDCDRSYRRRGGAAGVARLRRVRRAPRCGSVRSRAAPRPVPARRGVCAGTWRRRRARCRPPHRGLALLPAAVAADDGTGMTLRGRHGSQVQQVQRRGLLAHARRRHVQIVRRRLDVGVAQQALDAHDVDAAFQQMGGERMPQRVNPARLVRSPRAAWPPGRCARRCADRIGRCRRRSANNHSVGR